MWFLSSRKWPLKKTCLEYQTEREREKEKTNKGTVPTGFFCIAFFSTGYLCVDKLWCASHQQTKRHSWMLSNSRGEWIKSRSWTNNLVSILVSYSFLFQLILGVVLEIESQSWKQVISASLFFFFCFFFPVFFLSNICCSHLAIIHKQKRSADRPISLSFLPVWNDGALISCSKRKGREGGCSSHYTDVLSCKSIPSVCVFYPLSFSHTSGHISARRKVSTVWYVWHGGGERGGFFFPQLLNG